MSKGTCDVCGKQAKVYVCASTMGAMSFGYCHKCLSDGLEPYWVMVAYISGAGKFPDDINDTYIAEVRRILDKIGKSEEEFVKDVDQAIHDMTRMEQL